MAKATICTLLGLDQFAAILGINPWHFNQMYCNAYPEEDACHDLWYQYAWMDADKASREDLASAISQAESIIADYVGFWPAPNWILEEMHRYPRPGVEGGPNPYDYSPGWHALSRRKTMKADWGYYRHAGRRRADLLAAWVPVTYSDLDGDGYNETASLDLSTVNLSAVESPGEIGLFPTTDTAEVNRIRFTTTDLVAKTVTGRSALFISPALWEIGDPIDGDDSASYLTVVNVCRVYTSDEGGTYAPVTFGWETTGSPALIATAGTLIANAPDRSLLVPVPATWDSTLMVWKVLETWPLGEPHHAALYYQAGWPATLQGYMGTPFARAVAALAVALLHKPLCSCDRAEALVAYWQEIPERATYRTAECPFGPQRGAWEAYASVSMMRMQGVVANV